MDRDLFKVEVCANSYQSCLAARQGGADRVELCASMLEGGTTPSYGTICKARDIEGLRLHVLIRPRESDFHYTSEEIDIMMKDISIWLANMQLILRMVNLYQLWQTATLT